MLRQRMSCFGLGLVVLLALASSTVAWAGEDPSGASDSKPPVRAGVPTVPAGVNDMLVPPGAPGVFTGARANTTDLETAPAPGWSRVAAWERLAALPSAQCANAVIEIELGSGAGPADHLAAAQIGRLWGEGRYEEAIVELRSYESAGGKAALGIAWKQPVAPSEPLAVNAGGTDVRIGARTGGRMASLDYDAASGALYAVVGWGPATGGEAYWTVNRSTNRGLTWSETYAWYAGATAGLIDMSASVVGGYVYVGYVPGDAANEYRLRRCVASTGMVDNAYAYQVVVDVGALTIREVTVVSNAMTSSNRVYCFAIQSDDAVRFFWTTASTATSFTESSPAGASAATGLDASWNPGYTTYYLQLAYAGTDGLIHVQRFGASGWAGRTLLASTGVIHRSGVAISAYQDAVICVYEYMMTNGRGIAYAISYEGGNEPWDLYNFPYEPDGTTISGYQCPDVDAHDGNGTAIIASAECGEPDRVYYRKRAGYAPGLWETASQFNDNDVTTGTPTTLAHVPVLGPASFSHGAIYFYGSTPYFDLPMLGTADVSGPAPASGVRLYPPAPSPFGDHAVVRFTLPVSGAARLEVFDVRGRRVATLLDGTMPAGTHSLPMDGRGFASGVYFCRLSAAGFEQVNRFAVIH